LTNIAFVAAINVSKRQEIISLATPYSEKSCCWLACSHLFK